MLKRLELVGFKSFAEKTQFDFGPGITAIVGPNGSGKSNVVDAVRWILGEQSAKSLRGGEMADVIFNGSSTRRGAGLAEVTLVLDNADRRLARDAAEVQVTRRVYRGGEGEYLINKQPVRLRDVKDLFLGTGAGSSAYCIIEQGRVEVLLQSSTRERRVIFEEAAGISRFKAKKQEALRKLEHVEQNLLRLRDVSDEVGRRLETVKAQAARAQRYLELANELRDLRVAVGLREYHACQEALKATDAELARARAELDRQATQATAWDDELAALDARLGDCQRARQAREQELAGIRERLAATLASWRHECEQARELAEELAAMRVHLRARREAAASLRAECDAANLLASELAKEVGQCAKTVAELQAARQALADQAHRQREESREAKAALLEAMRTVARLHNEHVSILAQVQGLKQQRWRLEQKSTQVNLSLTQVGAELRELQDAERAIHENVLELRQRCADHRGQQEGERRLLEDLQRDLQSARARWVALTSRLEALENLERTREGLGSGVRQLLALLDDPGEPLREHVVGLVAHLLTAQREFAGLIDVVLQDRSQWFVARDPAAVERIRERLADSLRGRVTVWAPALTTAARRQDWNRRGQMAVPVVNQAPFDHPGIVARASKLVTVSDVAPDLPELLLGNVLVVRDAAAARELAAVLPGHRFVTLTGELLEPDGSWTLGQHAGATGMLSRKSELLDLRDEGQTLAAKIGEVEAAEAASRERLRELDARVERDERELQVCKEQSGDLRTRVFQLRQRQDGLTDEAAVSATELRQIDEDVERLAAASAAAEAELTAGREREAEVQRRIDALEAQLPATEKLLEACQQEVAAAQVASAKAVERRQAADARARALNDENGRRLREESEASEACRRLLERLERSQLAALATSAANAALTAAVEAGQGALEGVEEELRRLRGDRQGLMDRTAASRQALQTLRDETHALEMRAAGLAHDANGIVARLREEHEVDLADLYARHQPDPEPLDLDAQREAIQDLRRKLARLGNVSLDAITELAELESRSAGLQAQLADLSEAKRTLDEIITAINQDSRRAFQETFEAIRGHFQELFRRLFGGGMADVVLEDPNDVLETGIEIVARPPGKELRAISLLSGGEKTLTAVALLLAIFRAKPSPFCILDEVDAALDEANTGRLAAVLQEFTDQAQFIMITHSKRTMTAANVLYGVTMQEAGVSKRVAVRLEDWPDEAAEPREHRRAA